MTSPWLLLAAAVGGTLIVKHGKAYGQQDRTPPTITIQNPVMGAILTSQSFIVAGIASDNVGVSSVYVKVTDTAGTDLQTFKLASGTTSWNTTMNIARTGPIKIVAKAIDSSGNEYSVSLDASIDIAIPPPPPPPPPQPSTLDFMHGLNKLSFALSTVTTQPKLIKFEKDNGFGFIRVRLYWEKYLQDPTTWMNRLKRTADAADANGLKIVYDFHQYGQSSYFNPNYIGWPPSMVSAAIGALSSYPTVEAAQKAWMRKWWDNAGTFNGMSYWDAQTDFMLKAFGVFKDRFSTLAYEIINEPDLYEVTDLAKYKTYLEYIGNKLVLNDNDAWIIADHRFNKYGTSNDFYNIDQIKATIPTISNGRVVYSPHTYFKGNENLDAATGIWVVERIAQIQAAIGNIPVFIGEWNDVGHDPVRMQKIVNAFKAKNFSHALYVFEHAVDTANACFNANYDKVGNCWDSLLFAMGRTQIGTPK